MVLLGLAYTASATPVLTGVSLGTAAPPGTLGGYSVTGFGADASPVNSFVSSVSSGGVTVSFGNTVRHDVIGNGWATWSHGYAGSVYDTASANDPQNLTLSLSANVAALYFYVEPVNFSVFSFTATAQDGTTLTENINGNAGASGFGFYASAGNSITSITISGGDLDGFAVGEFGAAVSLSSVPDSGNSLAYAALAFVGLLACRWFLRPAFRG